MGLGGQMGGIGCGGRGGSQCASSMMINPAAGADMASPNMLNSTKNILHLLISR